MFLIFRHFQVHESNNKAGQSDAKIIKDTVVQSDSLRIVLIDILFVFEVLF